MLCWRYERRDDWIFSLPSPHVGGFLPPGPHLFPNLLDEDPVLVPRYPPTSPTAAPFFRLALTFRTLKSIHLFSLLIGFTLLGVVSANAQTITLSPERTNHAASLLNSGEVLITGGVNLTATLDSAVLYDPTIGTIGPTGTMTTPRADHTSTLLPDGQVLVTGGDQGTVDLQTAELYDPSTGVFTQTFHGMRIARSQHTATLLFNGQVLIVGGKSADLYDPAAQTFTATTGTPLDRRSHSSILLQDGTVLVVGGYINNIATVAAEIYDPSTQQFTVINQMKMPRANLASALLLTESLYHGRFLWDQPA